ncbi:MAG: hypothetical protein BGO90_15660 [Legionella sp. 40-6]|nr:MAG: hypothetical protein BGO90_15660 [Legionella sp. 40-6]
MNEKLKKVIEEIEKNSQIGNPSDHYPIQNKDVTAVYNIPFAEKPITSLMQQLNITVEKEGLRSVGNLHSQHSTELVIPSISNPSHTASLSLEKCKHLLNTGKIYLNIDVGLSEEQFKNLLPKSNHDENAILDFSEEMKYQSSALCHAQEISFLTSFTTHIKKNKKNNELISRFIGLPQAGTVVSDNLWLLSTPEFNFSKHKEINSEMYLTNMLRSLFHAATQEHCEFLIIPTLHFGHHKNHNELFYSALIRVAKHYPKVNVIYNTAHQRKDLEERIAEEQCDNIAITEKDVLAIASYLQQQKCKTALYNPTTLEAVYGYADIGCYWQYTHKNKFGKSLSAILGNVTTCVLNSHGINSEAFARIHTFSLMNKPADEQLNVSSDSDNFTTASDVSSTNPDEKIDSIEPPAHGANEENKEPEATSTAELPSEPQLPLEPEAPIVEATTENSDIQVAVPPPALPLPASQPASPPISPRDAFFPPVSSTASPSSTTGFIQRLSNEQRDQVQLHINRLQREYNSWWPDFYRSRKLDKTRALTQLLKDANEMPLADAVQKARSQESVVAGFFSKRTKKLLDELENSVHLSTKI